MKQKTEQEIADGIIKMLDDAGCTYDEMLKIIQRARDIFNERKQ